MELSVAIQHCLDGLDDDFRVVVVLVDIQGMDYAEAAEAADTPLGTIKSRLARATLKITGLPTGVRGTFTWCFPFR